MDNVTPCTPAANYRTGATRVDGWTPDRQALFLETLAHSGMVSEACREVGMSVTSAYIFRRRSHGVAFALGWKAAILLARDGLEERLLEVTFTGVETTTSKDEDGVTRRRAINRGLARDMLNRLDRQAFALDNPEAATARAIGSAFGDFIDLIASGCSREDVAAFLECHPDPLANANAKREARGHAGGTAQTRKLVEESAILLGDTDVTEVASSMGISARNLRRMQRGKKRMVSTR